MPLAHHCRSQARVSRKMKKKLPRGAQRVAHSHGHERNHVPEEFLLAATGTCWLDDRLRARDISQCSGFDGSASRRSCPSCSPAAAFKLEATIAKARCTSSTTSRRLVLMLRTCTR